MSFATTIPLLLGLVIWAGILALVIYLAVLLIKALRKYLKSGPVRQEKAEMARSLGEAIRYHRTRCKMTQEFVAETLCVSRQSVSTWENGFSDPNTSNLIALAKLYKISPEQLLEYAAGMPDGESNIPPYACCAPSSAAPVPVQGRPPFDFLATRTALPRLSFSTQSFYVTCFFLC